MSESDFMKRLQAMREGKSAEQPPSLKERLNKNGPPQRPGSSSAEDIRARIQAKFQKQSQPADVQRVAESLAAASPTPVVEPEQLPRFETQDIPAAQKKETAATQQWTPEDGGVCPNCGTFNLGHVAFCGSCEYMLLRSEEVVEIITSYPLTEIKGLVITFVQKLEKLKIKTTEDILRVASRASNRGTLVKHTGMSERSLVRLVHQANFCRVPSMGPENAAMLDLIGVTDLDKMLSFSAPEIYKKIQQAKIKLNQQGILFLPTKSQVNLWFEEAAELPPLKIDP